MLLLWEFTAIPFFGAFDEDGLRSGGPREGSLYPTAFGADERGSV